MVNRIWQHHFGRGIVATSDHFGVQGQRPAHPQQLDRLAGKFIESSWSVKALHKMILLSSTYQQAHVENQAGLAADPENNWLWRMPRRRLDAEEIRDALLVASGEIDFTSGGTLFTEGYKNNEPERELYVVDISGKEYFPPFQQPRRSVYLPVIRNGCPEILKLFDVANSHEPTGVRGETTVAPQMLFMLNSRFVREQAESLALELIGAAKSFAPAADTTAERIQSAYKITLGRPAAEEEVYEGREFLARYESLIEKLDKPPGMAEKQRGPSESAYADLIRGTKQLVAYHRLRGMPLNGVDQRLEFSSDEALNAARTAFSIECWIKPEAIQKVMMIVGRDGQAERYWKLGVYGREVAGKRQNVIFSEFFSQPLGSSS